MSKLYFETCGRCSGDGVVHYGNVTFTRMGRQDRYCFACEGTGQVSFKTSPEAREKARQKREEKKQAEIAERNAEYNAKCDAERERNGGQTDAEIANELTRKAREEFRAKAQQIISELQSFSQSFGFAHSIAEEMHQYCRVPSGRGLTITIEILAKQHGRRGSKKFWAAHDQYEDIFNDVLIPAAEKYRNRFEEAMAAA